MTGEHSFYFICDGGPSFKEGAATVCGVSDCFEPSSGVFLVLDCDTDDQVGTIDLCSEHARKFATGGPG